MISLINIKGKNVKKFEPVKNSRVPVEDEVIIGGGNRKVPAFLLLNPYGFSGGGYGKDMNIYEIPEESDKAQEELLKYVKENNLSKNAVKAILSNNAKEREIEDLIEGYFDSWRQEEHDLEIARRNEREKNSRNRLKTMIAFQDEMRQMDAEIWANRCKTNEKINDIQYKALFGG